MEPYLLGIDIGTGSTKTVAVDFKGNALCSSQTYYTTHHPQPGYSEQKPQEIFEAFVSSIKETVSKMKSMPAAVSLSSAMHSVMAVDEQGQPLSNLIIWSDARSSTIADEIRHSAQGSSLYNATGTPVHSMSPLSKIIWWREHLPELFQTAYKFISIKEYIWYQLFGEFAIDYSIASATGLFDIEKLVWCKEALALAKISEERLSQPVPTAYIQKGMAEEMAALLNVPASTPFCMGASDGCLANLGTYALQPGIASVTIGTSGAVRVARNEPLRNYSTMSFNYLLDEQTFICGGPINNGGNVVQWLLKNFLLKETTEDSYKKLFDIIANIPAGCEGLIFLPYINGERSLVWDEESCGVFFGIKPQHTQAFFLRATLEGICYALKDVLLTLETASHPIHQINASGGFTHSTMWLQLLADITGKKVSVQQTDDASAIGAALLALKALNIISDYSLPQHQSKIVYPQQQAAEVYKKNFSIYKTLYPSLKNSMHLFYSS